MIVATLGKCLIVGHINRATILEKFNAQIWSFRLPQVTGKKTTGIVYFWSKKTLIIIGNGPLNQIKRLMSNCKHKKKFKYIKSITWRQSIFAVF